MDHSFSWDKFIFEMTIEEDSLSRLSLKTEQLRPSSKRPKDALALEVERQVRAYLEQRLKKFDLPLKLHGTNFQKLVWQELAQIPYGEVCSYRDIAQKISREKAFRAVGSANGANPIPIILPCHRVVTSSNRLGGYAFGAGVKKYLLELEGVKPLRD